MKYKVVIHKAEEGGYWAEVPAVSGCFSQGETVDEVMENIHEALAACLKTLAEPECAGCEIVSVCGGCCLDWARKDSRGNGWFSPTECSYRRGLVKAAKEFLERVKGRPLVMHAIRDRLDLCNQEWRPKRKGE